MIYRASHYVCDDTVAITAFSDIGEPECSVTINLSEYGLTPENNEHVFIPYYKIAAYDKDVLMRIIKDLVEDIKDVVFIGYHNKCRCLYVKLKSNWRDLCEGDDI